MDIGSSNWRRFCVRRFFEIAFCWSVLSSVFAAAPQEFRQEIARHRELTNGLPGKVKLVMVVDGKARALVGGQWLGHVGEGWKEVPGVNLPDGYDEAIQMLAMGKTYHVATARDVFSVVDGVVTSLGWPSRIRVNQLAVGPDGVVYLASAAGLHRRADRGWEPLRVADGLGRVWGAEDVLGVAFDSKGRLWFACKAGVGCHEEEGWKFYEPKEGLPWNDFTCVAGGLNGEVWFGTHLGAIRWDGKEFHYRQGPRWLPNDDVRGIAIDSDGSAWFTTAGGLGMIEGRTMTLAAKAELFENEIEKYIKRTPFGYVAEGPLKGAGDKSSSAPNDSDNDGLWTAMYGAGECFAYGATRDPKAKARATKAFEALRFLQKVTQGGSHSPPKGYVARTIRPKDWPDPNAGRVAQDIEERKGDELWKVYEPRWPKSADGEWYWKSDTSSDELDGHLFFYPLYHDLVADTAEEKARVLEVVRDLVDHLIAHDFTLTDHDGKPTRWGVYSPKSLNDDQRWWAERGLNSLSILTYLSVAQHLTGDAKYEAAARKLIDKNGYAQNLMFPKVQFGPGSGNQSDDEMAIMCYYTLLRCSKDEALKNIVRYSFYSYSANEAPELNPFFNYAYAVHGMGKSITNLWGVFKVEPFPDWQEDSLATLRGFPLDRIDWSHRNSHRLDLVRFGQIKAKDLYEPQRSARGHRQNGKVLPVENRHFNHWNTDPWHLDYNGSGRELGAGTVFLLPYYMGLYHGFIQKP